MAIQAPTTAKNAVRIGAHHQRADASVDAIPANPKLAKPVATLRRESTIAMMNLLLLYGQSHGLDQNLGQGIGTLLRTVSPTPTEKSLVMESIGLGQTSVFHPKRTFGLKAQPLAPNPMPCDVGRDEPPSLAAVAYSSGG